MNRKVKCIIISFALTIILMAICYKVINKVISESPKSLLEFYCSAGEREGIEDLVYQDNQQVTIDGYTFTLEEVMTEYSMPTVYCKFAVTKDNQDMTKEEFIDKWDFFGEDEGRFRFYMAYDENIGDVQFKYKATKNVLYVYGEFLMQQTHGEDDMVIYLYDKNSGKTDEKLEENSSGKFNLKKQNKAKTYYYKDEEIVINPFRFSITSEIGIFCGKLEIYYKDKSKLVVKDGDSYNNVKLNVFGTQGENPYGSGYSNESYCDFVFKNPINVDNIDYICISGERLD